MGGRLSGQIVIHHVIAQVTSIFISLLSIYSIFFIYPSIYLSIHLSVHSHFI